MKRGFIFIPLIVAVAVVVAGGIGYWFLVSKTTTPPAVVGVVAQTVTERQTTTASGAVNKVSSSPAQVRYDIETEGGSGNGCDGKSAQQLVRAERGLDGRWATTTISSLGIPSAGSSLYKFLSVDQKSGLVFLNSFRCFTEGASTGVWSYNLQSGEFHTLSILYSNNAPHGVSPDGTMVAQGQSFDPGIEVLKLLDLVKDTSTTLVILQAGERFGYDCEMGPCAASSIHWLDNTTIEYNVYSAASSTPLETRRIRLQ